MKRVEELGISPLPWRITEWNPFAAVESANNVVGIVSTGKIGNEADARLIAAAPDLYEALSESIDCICAGCPHNPCEVACVVVKKCRKALAKASRTKAAK